MDKLGNHALFKNEGEKKKKKKSDVLPGRFFKMILHASGMQQTMKRLCPLKAPLQPAWGCIKDSAEKDQPNWPVGNVPILKEEHF